MEHDFLKQTKMLMRDIKHETFEKRVCSFYKENIYILQMKTQIHCLLLDKHPGHVLLFILCRIRI